MPPGIGYGKRRKKMSSRNSKRDFRRKSVPKKINNNRPTAMRGGFRL